MKTEIRYIVDEKGKRTAVIIPYAMWEKFIIDNEKLKNKIAVLTGIKEGIKEVKSKKNRIKNK